LHRKIISIINYFIIIYKSRLNKSRLRLITTATSLVFYTLNKKNFKKFKKSNDNYYFLDINPATMFVSFETKF